MVNRVHYCNLTVTRNWDSCPQYGQGHIACDEINLAFSMLILMRMTVLLYVEIHAAQVVYLS